MNNKFLNQINFINEFLLFLGLIIIAIGSFYLSANIYANPIKSPVLGINTQSGLVVNNIQQKNIATNINIFDSTTEMIITVNNNGNNSLHFDLGNYINNSKLAKYHRIELYISDAYLDNIDITLLINNQEYTLLSQGLNTPVSLNYEPNSNNEIKLLLIPNQPIYYNYQFKLKFLD